MNTFTCFGEVLWDVFPDFEVIGGAPLNVALRLKSYNNNVSIISAIGNDILGERLIDYIEENKLSSENIQQNSYNTGSVKVTLTASGSASYEIEAPAAWDFIKATNQAISKVQNSDLFIYGSLACRNKVAKNTLIELLKHAKYKVFDVNLRTPFYSIELIDELMHHANFIKFNDEEIELVCNKLNSEAKTLDEQIQYISKTYNVDIICVTLGDKGAILLKEGKLYSSKGFKVTVKDTVGAGDSFLATLLNQLTKNTNTHKALEMACAVGALVASKKGANPEIGIEDISNLVTVN